MAVVNMQEAKTRLSQLVARAETGEEILIACAGRPAVRLAPVSLRHPVRGHGSMPELAAWADAILEPLPEDELRRWGAATEGARVGRLLDTHALIWWFAGSGQLSEAARAAIEDPAHPKLLSATSVWEIATKRRLGRLPEAERAGLVRDLPAAVHGAGFVALPVALADAARAGGLPEPSRDPFDRMLIA